LGKTNDPRVLEILLEPHHCELARSAPRVYGSAAEVRQGRGCGVDRAMTAALKRLVFVLAFIPFSVYAFARWIVTGESALDLFIQLEEWRDK
jgi:hypothetical protein